MDKSSIKTIEYPEILLLGSGMMKKENALTLDKNSKVKPDILHDLDQFPYPFPDNSFSKIECLDILEHLNDLVKVMSELHRIGKDGAEVVITTPHFSSSNAFTDPTHRHFLGYYSFDYFSKTNEWAFYTEAEFRKISVELHFHPSFKNRIVSIIGNRWPRFYERHLTWIFPAWYIYVKLQVVKGETARSLCV